jgi:hypothetical protein
MSNWTYKPGQWNVHCDVCGFKFKSSEIKKRWDGLMVCHNDYELDHPQKFLRVPQEKITVPFVRKQNDDTFIYVCTAAGATGYADLAEADCARADKAFPLYNDLVSTT